MKVKEGSERGKCWLKAQHSENEDHGIISRQIDAETMETVADFSFLDSKITADGIADMKLKDVYSLGGKL